MVSGSEGLKMAIVAMLALLLSGFAAAADGRIPIGTAPYTINSPGSYYLSADLVYGGALPAVKIIASDVNLDLNGHYVWEVSTASGTSCVYSTGVTNLRVFNGFLQGGYIGLDVENVPAGLIAAGGLSASGYAWAGIYVLGSSSYPGVLVRNDRLSSYGGSSGGTLVAAIDLVQVQGGLVATNTIIGNGTANGDGIFLYATNSVTVEDNAVTNCYAGVHVMVSGSIKALRNNASGNAYGFMYYASTYCEVAESLAAKNAYGIYFSSGSYAYRNNYAQGNTTANYTPGGATDEGGNY